MSRRSAARLGVIVGFLGWMIGWTIVCLAGGRGGVLAATLPVGTGASLGLALMTILLLESIDRAPGRGPRRSFAIPGALAVDIGLLWLLANHWLAPIIEADPAMVQLMGDLRAIHRTTDAIPVGLLAAGCAVLAMAMLTPARREGTPGAGG